MSSINSDFGSGSLPPDFSDSEDVNTEASSTNSASTGPTDTLSSSSSSSTSTSLTGGIDLTGGVSYLGYLTSVGKPILDNKQLMKETAAEDFSSNTIKDFLLSILLNIQNTRKFRQQVIDNGAGVTDLRNQQNDQINILNAQLKIYNKGDGSSTDGVKGENSAITNLNAAIQQFNSGQITEQELRAAIDTYNSYATGRNAGAVTDTNTAITTYNEQVTENNTQIETINAQRATLGLPPIAPQDQLPPVTELSTVALPPGPLTPPLNTLPARTTIPTVSTFSAPPTQDDLNKLVDTVLSLTIDASKGLSDKVQDIQSVANFIRFQLYPKRANAPNAFIEQFENRSPAARGGSTFGLSFFLAGSDPNLLATLSLSNFKKQLSEFGDPIQTDTTNLPTNTLINGSLNGAAASSVQGFKDVQAEIGTNVVPGTPAGNLVLALAFAQQISQLNAGGSLDASVEGTFEADPSLAGLSSEEKQQVLGLIGSGIKQNLSLTALLQIAIAAGLPGLVGQVVGQATDTDLGKGLGSATTTDQINQLLGSGVVQEALKNLLQDKSRGNNTAVTLALEQTLLQGAVFATPSGEASAGTPLVGGNGAPLVGADGQPLGIPENGTGIAQLGGVNSGESLRASLLNVSDALGGFTPTATSQASSSAGSAIAGFAFTSAGQFQSQLALNLENQGFNSASARNLSVDAALALINQTAIPGIIGSDLDQDVGLAGGAAIGKQEVQQEILNGTDAGTQLQESIQTSQQKDDVETTRQLRDEIVRQLVAQSIGFDQALLLANSTAQQTIQADKADQTIATSSLNQADIQSSLTSELIKRGVLDSFSASDAANKVITEAYNKSSAITTAATFRSALAAEITNQGIADQETAASIAAGTSVGSNGAVSDALSTTTSGKQLSPQELANDLQTSLLAILTGQIGVEQAKKLSGAIVKEVVGFEATQGEPTRNPSSISNQIHDSVTVAVNQDKDKFSDSITQNFRTFSSPNIDLFTQIQRLLDPANNILMSSATGTMYDRGPSGSTFQTPGSSRGPNVNTMSV